MRRSGTRPDLHFHLEGPLEDFIAPAPPTPKTTPTPVICAETNSAVHTPVQLVLSTFKLRKPKLLQGCTEKEKLQEFVNHLRRRTAPPNDQSLAAGISCLLEYACSVWLSATGLVPVPAPVPAPVVVLMRRTNVLTRQRRRADYIGTLLGRRVSTIFLRLYGTIDATT